MIIHTLEGNSLLPSLFLPNGYYVYHSLNEKRQAQSLVLKTLLFGGGGGDRTRVSTGASSSHYERSLYFIYLFHTPTGRIREWGACLVLSIPYRHWGFSILHYDALTSPGRSRKRERATFIKLLMRNYFRHLKGYQCLTSERSPRLATNTYANGAKPNHPRLFFLPIAQSSFYLPLGSSFSNVMALIIKLFSFS